VHRSGDVRAPVKCFRNHSSEGCRYDGRGRIGHSTQLNCGAQGTFCSANAWTVCSAGITQLLQIAGEMPVSMEEYHLPNLRICEYGRYQHP
jgi:hypothetical protein